MKDALSDFIQQHRIELDDKNPPERIWGAINKKIVRKQLWLQPIRYWQAAAVLFFVLFAYAWSKNDSLVLTKSVANKEFADTEAFYTQQISEKTNLILSKNATGLSSFTHDFQQLDAMYMVLKEELALRPSEKVREAMVLNLLVRINLLNAQLHQLDVQEAKAVNS
jgi:hypothetical protein